MASTKLSINLYISSTFDQNVTQGEQKKTPWLTTAQVHDGFVYKGPFKKGASALSLVVWRSAWFSIWGDEVYVPQTVVYNTDLDAFFIRSSHLDSPHLGTPHLGSPHLDSPHLGTPHLGTHSSFKVGKEDSYSGGQRSTDVLRSKGSLPFDTWKAIIYHFILCYITCCDNKDLQDVLIAPDGRPYHIDFEEMCEQDKGAPTTLWDLVFFRKPARVYWPSIQAVIAKAKPAFASLLKDRVIPHLERIGTRVNNETGIRFEHEFLVRARLALSLCCSVF